MPRFQWETFYYQYLQKVCRAKMQERIYILKETDFCTGSDPQIDFVDTVQCLPIYFLKIVSHAAWILGNFFYLRYMFHSVHQSPTDTSDNFIGMLMALYALRSLKMGTGGVCPAWIVLPLNRFFRLSSSCLWNSNHKAERAAERLMISTLFRRGLTLRLHGNWIASHPWRGWYLQVRK